MLNKYIIILSCLLLMTACQQSKTTTLTQSDLKQLTDEQITQINQQSCQRQDRYEVMASASHPLQLQLDQLIRSFPNAINGKKLNYRIYLNTQPNAWASLNGCIRVTSGLMKTLTDNEIQAVIAHELGHIALNHSINAFHYAKSAEIKNNGEITLMIPQSLSQRQELEADEYAVNLLKHYNISPDGLMTMLDKLNHHQKQTNSSHPDVIARKKNLLTKIGN